MIDTRRGSGWIAIALGLAAACGGDDGSTGISTGFPSEQKLSTLTDEETQQACRSVNEDARSVITPTVYTRAACVPLALPASAMETASGVKVDVAKCQASVDMCVAKNTAQTEKNLKDDAEEECSQASAEDLAGCDATIGEWEACMNGLLDQMQRLFAEMNCQNADKLTDENYKFELPNPDNIPQCQSIIAKCPDADLGLE
jgi:hypothetical protein